MGSNPANDEVREKGFDKETGGSGTVKSSQNIEKEREISKAESLPGWTIMRPLRKRANKASVASTTDASANRNETKGIAEGDLKVTETNDTIGSGNGEGEVEALHDLRSDDELLGEDDEGQPRAIRENGDPGNHTLQSNGATAEERAMNGGGEYKVYRRRWFGLVQLVLLNIIVSWDASSLSLAQANLFSRTSANASPSGYPSLQARPPFLNTMPSLNRPSTG